MDESPVLSAQPTGMEAVETRRRPSMQYAGQIALANLLPGERIGLRPITRPTQQPQTHYNPA